jgi:hypothetical protein
MPQPQVQQPTPAPVTRVPAKLPGLLTQLAGIVGAAVAAFDPSSIHDSVVRSVVVATGTLLTALVHLVQSNG